VSGGLKGEFVVFYIVYFDTTAMQNLNNLSSTFASTLSGCY